MNYNEIKKSADGMPTWDSFIPLLLNAAKNKETFTNRSLCRAAIELIKDLPKQYKDFRYEKDNGVIIENRAGFSVSLLKNAGLLNYPERNTYTISHRGLELINEYGNDLNEKIVKNEKNYIEHIDRLNKSKVEKDKFDVQLPEDIIPNEILMEVIDNNEIEKSSELLERMRNISFDSFERLVVKLLEKMGYSGEQGDSIVTNKSNDGGIDGIINQDPLGTRKVYLQAKRYSEDNKVGQPQIHNFIGALKDIQGDQGVFITTSYFSEKAKLSAKTNGIILIDCNRLTELMLKYKVGVKIKEVYEILDIDEDFFENL